MDRRKTALIARCSAIPDASGMEQKIGSSGKIPNSPQTVSKNYEILGQASRHTGKGLHKIWAQSDDFGSAHADQTRPVCIPDVSGMSSPDSTLSGKIDFDPKLNQINNNCHQVLIVRSQGSRDAISKRSSPNFISILGNQRKEKTRVLEP